MITKDIRFMRYVRRTLDMLNDPDSSTDDCLDCSRDVMEWILEQEKEEGRMKIWVLMISTPAGETVSAFESGQSAFFALAEYVEQKWDENMPDEHGRFIEHGRDGAVDVYFEQMASAPAPEHYTLEQVEVEASAAREYGSLGTMPPEKMHLTELVETALEKLEAENLCAGDGEVGYVRAVLRERPARLEDGPLYLCIPMKERNKLT